MHIRLKSAQMKNKDFEEFLERPIRCIATTNPAFSSLAEFISTLKKSGTAANASVTFSFRLCGSGQRNGCFYIIIYGSFLFAVGACPKA
jgi:hypothetical protein